MLPCKYKVVTTNIKYLVLYPLSSGPLSAVSNLRAQSSSTNITITWDAPFSLNLTTAEPDIQYCVDVYDSASGVLLHSECGIIEERYTYSPSNPYLYMFTVTPRSNVDGALNGTTLFRCIQDGKNVTLY